MNWIIKESDNYIFNYRAGSIAENEIDKIINLQETCYNSICSCLNVKTDFKINYYLCDTPEEIGVLYGDNEPCNGFAREPDKIYAVYNEKVKCVGFHEDAHIISYTIAVPPQTFLREGLAMFFDKVSLRIPNYMWVQFFIDNDIYVNINDLMFNENFYNYSDLITYPIAGAFVEYLILLFGIDKFKAFYSSLNKSNFETNFLKIFKLSLSAADKQFINYVNSIGKNTLISDMIKDELKKRKLF